MLRRKRSNDTSLDVIAGVLDGYELPSFSQVVVTALDELADPDVSLGNVAAILQNDPGLSVHLLRLANSASMGLRSSVDSLDRAVAMLGRNQIESILIGRAVTNSISPASPLIDERRFWVTAATRAVVAAHLAAVLDPARRSEHFTAALLQDMALPVLADHVEGYDTVLAGWYDGTIEDLDRAETDAFGWDHGAVAAYMCQTWGFPENLVASVKTHHTADDASPAHLAGGWHEVDEARGPRLLADRAASIGLSDEQITELLDHALSQVHEVAELFV